MKASGIFYFKSLSLREKGSFVDQNGKTVEYKASHVLICDELLDDNQVKERRFSFPIENKTLADDFRILDLYTKISIDFDLRLYGSNVALEPIKVNLL